MAGKKVIGNVRNLHIGFTKDTTAQFLEVPCGYCPVCIALKQSYAVQRAQMMSMTHDLWMGTLTYKNSTLPRTEVNGYNIPHVQISDWQNMIKRIRRKNLLGMPFKALAVTEYGGKKHRPHMHFILATPKIPNETRSQRYQREKEYYKVFLTEWRRNIATCYNEDGKLVPNTRNPEWIDLCEFVETWRNGKRYCTYDFHWIDPTVTDCKGKLHDESDVAFYVTKYIVKADKYANRLKSALKLNLSPEEFKKTWSIFRPKALISKGWGLPTTKSGEFDPKISHHIRKGIEHSQRNNEMLYSVFINPSTGQTFPLAPYYRKRFESVNDVLTYFYRKDDTAHTGDGFDCEQSAFVKFTTYEIEQKYKKFDRVQKMVGIYHDEDRFHNVDRNPIEIHHETDYFIDDTLDMHSLYECMCIDLGSEYARDVFGDSGTLDDFGDIPPEFT